MGQLNGSFKIAEKAQGEDFRNYVIIKILANNAIENKADYVAQDHFLNQGLNQVQKKQI